MPKNLHVETADIKNLVSTFDCGAIIEKYDLMVLYDTKRKMYRAICNDKMCKSLYITPEGAKARCYGMITGDVEIKKLMVDRRK